MKKITSSAILALLLSSPAFAVYDASTTDSRPLSPREGISSLDTVILPKIVAATVIEALDEAVEYGEATSQRVKYKVTGIKAKMKGPVKFPGGTLQSLSAYFHSIGLSSYVGENNTIYVSYSKSKNKKLK